MTILCILDSVKPHPKKMVILIWKTLHSPLWWSKYQLLSLLWSPNWHPLTIHISDWADILDHIPTAGSRPYALTTFTDAQVAPQHLGKDSEHHIMLRVKLYFFGSSDSNIWFLGCFLLDMLGDYVRTLVSWESFKASYDLPCEAPQRFTRFARPHAAGHFGPTGCAQHPKA